MNRFNSALLVAQLLGYFFAMCASDKVLIMTYVYNRPDFIELHYKTLKAFLLDDYEYVVFNDAPNKEMKKNIQQTCQKLGVRCFRVPQHWHDGRQSPNLRHCDGIRYSLETIAFDHHGIAVMLDADMFPIRPISIAEYMQGYDLIGGYQARAEGSLEIVYTSPCLVFLDMRTLPNKRSLSFESGTILGLRCDVGASTYHYFKNNQSLKKKLYVAYSKDGLPHDAEQLEQLGLDQGSIKLILDINRVYGFEFHGDYNFLHYYAGGSNWPGYSQDWINEKNRLLYAFIDKQIQYYAAINC